MAGVCCFQVNVDEEHHNTNIKFGLYYVWGEDEIQRALPGIPFNQNARLHKIDSKQCCELRERVDDVKKLIL